MVKKEIVLKHSMSSAADQLIAYSIDESTKAVEVWMDSFDSALFASLVVSHLTESERIRAFRDDSEDDPPPSAWATFLNFAGSRFRAEVTILADQRPTVVLRPAMGNSTPRRHGQGS